MSGAPVRVARIAGCVAVALLGAATVAGAQVASSFRELQGSLHGGAQLTVTDQTGVVTNGRLITLSEQSLRLMLQSGTPIDVSESSVAKIVHVASRVRRGALVGLISGAAVGALVVALTPPCKGFCVSPTGKEVILPAAAILGAIGAGVGALVGAARSDHRLIYLAQGREVSAP